jgi:AbrB family looped-hinge helix DNA binding protein
MKATGIIRRVDDIGRVVIPKEIRRSLKIEEGDPLEIYTERDGSIILKPYYKSWEEYALDFYDSHPHIFLRKDSPYVFYHWGYYTVCFINGNCNKNSRYGVAKRYIKDNNNYRIGEVAAYARAIGQPIDELIGYKGK